LVLAASMLTIPLLGCAGAQPNPMWAEVVRVETGDTADNARTETTVAQLTKELDSASVICVGEQHDNPAHHRFQHDVLHELLDQAQHSGREIGIGMEMFPRAFQPALDDYVRGSISEPELLRQTNWERTWGYDATMYAPLWRSAHNHGLRLLALNTPRDITRHVARHGFDALPLEVRNSLPELDLSDREHQRFFTAAMGGDANSPHAGAHTAKSSFYVAQVIWDETMASTAAAWIGVAPERRQMVVVAGNGHCHDSAIVRRVERRLETVNGLSILVKSETGELPDEVRSDFIVTVAAP